MTKSHILLCATALSAALMPSMAQAQIDEIIVTAQKREQSLQDVPISVTVFAGEILEERQIDSFEQLQFIAPGIAFQAGVNARQSATFIRGIGTSLFNSGIEGSVAISVDGVILGREGAGILDFSDLERVEVLRGPQGTLFGKNSSAGVISFVTKNPTDEFSGNLSASYGNFNETSLSGNVSGPLSDTVRGRLSAFYNTRDGFIENINPASSQKELNDKNDFGFRGKLAIDLSDTAELILGADYSNRDDNSGALTARSYSDGSPGTGIFGSGFGLIPLLSSGAGVTASPENRQIASEAPFFAKAEIFGGYAEASFAIGEHELVSLTSARRWESNDNNDADIIPNAFLEVNSGDLVQDQLSQEFRLVSPQGNRLSYVVGAYAFTQDIQDDQAAVGSFGLDAVGVIPAGTTTGSTFSADIEETNLALFGQGEYDVTDQFTLIGGLRLLHSDISASIQRTQAASAPSGAVVIGPRAFGPVDTAPLVASDKDTGLVWRLGGQYEASDEVNLFATLTRGYKAAGAVTGFETQEILTADGAGTGTFAIVEPEIPTQFEAGIRSRSTDGRVTANLTGFYTTIEDYQAQSLVPTASGVTAFSVVNAGKVKTYGFEAEGTVVPTDGLSLSAAVAYTNATFKDFPTAECYLLQPVASGECQVDANGNRFQDLAGEELGLSPDWVINLSGRYDFNPLSNGVAPFLQAGYQYRSSTNSGSTGDPKTIIDGYGLLDAQAGFSFMDERARFTLYGRNLTNQNFAVGIFGGVLDDGGTAQFVSFESERSYGARLSVDF